MRHVFPTSEIAHKWAHQTQDNARNYGNFSFNGATLRSYSTPIARLYANKRGTLALVSTRTYSATTAKHVRMAWDAVSHLPRVRVPGYVFGNVYGAGRYRGATDPKAAHAANLAYLEKQAADLLVAAQRAVLRRNVAWRSESAAARLEDWKTYAAFFGIRRKAPEYPAAAWSAALQRADRIENPDPKALDARERARAARKQSEYARRRLAEIDREIGAPDFTHFAERSDWRLHGAFDARGHYLHGRTGAVMLRINGEQIETSQGARIPLAAAPMVWKLYQDALAAGGREFEHIGMASRVRVGDYPIDRVEADGTLVAGCHRIPGSEIRSMARTLNLAGAV